MKVIVYAYNNTLRIQLLLLRINNNNWKAVKWHEYKYL